ncbi:hypothetical protein CONLIGDRAFT_687796 [Coniochaeta ligniaria NRRL 30616]|uniref:Uncharacterized protein n=1 Tax=Coniochaeta ligniaria NRRL 30616 TaxID=1408157 RepID=A0A1J7I3R8_9PEZI|nr:hypothetical protein CONLIGDRAFT_687796 [Coniochaeta ligniaria NRRL 30616]
MSSPATVSSQATVLDPPNPADHSPGPGTQRGRSPAPSSSLFDPTDPKNFDLDALWARVEAGIPRPSIEQSDKPPVPINLPEPQPLPGDDEDDDWAEDLDLDLDFGFDHDEDKGQSQSDAPGDIMTVCIKCNGAISLKAMHYKAIRSGLVYCVDCGSWLEEWFFRLREDPPVHPPPGSTA